MGIGLHNTRYYSALGEPVPMYYIYGNTVYTTHVLCRARLYKVMQLIRLLLPIPYLARHHTVTYT